MSIALQPAEAPIETVIDAGQRRGLLDTTELWRYRDLLGFLVWRGIKARYAQSVLGVGWAVAQPVFSMLVFTVVFGGLAKIDTGDSPYALFSFVGLVPWTYFTNALSDSAQALVTNASLIGKVYFPRLIMTLAAVSAKLVDFSIAFVLMLIMLACYGVVPGPQILLLPVVLAMMILSALGLGTLLSGLAVQFRDVAYAMTFATQLLMYAAPVVYPLELVPGWIRPFYAINPMVGVVSGFRACVLGMTPIPWVELLIGAASSVAIAWVGLAVFRSRERLFADVA